MGRDLHQNLLEAAGQLITESYSTGLLAFLRYLKAGIDPHDFAHEIESFYEDRGEDPPESFEIDEPYLFLDTPEFAEVKDDFIEYLKNHVSPDSADLPTYLFLTDAKLVPRQTWLIHFSDNAYDIARHGFKFGAEDYAQLGLTTHFSEKARKAGPGWNFAFIAGSRDAERAMHGNRGRDSTPKYGKEAVLFQSAGVKAYHQGDSEEQVVFWGPGVTERYHLEFVEGVWDISRGDGGGSIYSSEDIDDVVAWVQRNHSQYKRIIANRRVEKPLTSTPKAMRDALLNKKPERIPQPFDEPIKESEDKVCPKCGSKIRPAIPHKCPTGKHWAGGGEKFKTPIKESEDDLLTVVKNLVSNEHPDDHVPEDYRWAREKAFNPQEMVHMMPGGLPAWKIWIESEAKEDPDHYKDFPTKVTTITDPVIVSPGHIWDGWHRIAAAITNGLTSIPAIVGTHAR